MKAHRGIFKNILVPIPPQAYVIKSTAQVFEAVSSVYLPDKKYTVTSKLFIGKAVNETTMHPNVNYAVRYPEEFRRASGEDLPCQEVHAGMYAAILGIVSKSGMYKDMVETLGPENANAVLDFSMYSIIFRTNAAMNYAASMKNRMLFSESLWGDRKWSDFFNGGLAEDQALRFRNAWLERCKASGVTECWMCIDGSNSECAAKKSEQREQGKSKKRRTTGIVSCMYAVSADTGIPITYSTYRGSRPDSKEIFELITLLKSHGISPKGAVLDRGFGGGGIADALKEAGLSFIIMLEQKDNGTREMIERHGRDIKSNYENYIAGTERAYGTVDKCLVYKGDKEEGNVALFYDAVNGAARTAHLHEMVSKAVTAITKAILEKRRIPEVKYRQYVKIQKDETGAPLSCSADTAKIQRETDKKGFCAMRLSDDLGAAEAYRIYTLRQKCEKQFSMFKTQLGYDANRNHFTKGVVSKSFVGFASSIIRCTMVNAAKKAGLGTNTAIKELDYIHVGCYAGGEYIYSHTESEKEIALLKSLGVSTENLDGLAAELNERNGNAIIDPVRSLRATGSKSEKTRPGRKKGSKNLNKEKKAETPRRGRGRPKGSKNKKTLAREEAERKAAEQKEK